jgi:hypothetical protein
VQTDAAAVAPRRSEWAGAIEWAALSIIALVLLALVWKAVKFLRRVYG